MRAYCSYFSFNTCLHGDKKKKDRVQETTDYKESRLKGTQSIFQTNYRLHTSSTTATTMPDNSAILQDNK